MAENSLSSPFVRRPVMTMLLTVTIVLFGIIAYQRLPVNDLPSVDFPVINVTVNYPGASPATMASNVATPLERQFMQIAGLELITSSSTQGNTAFTLQFRLEKSVDSAATDVSAAINRASGSLPIDLPSPPTFTIFNPNDQPIIYITLTSETMTEGQLYDFASTNVAQRISILPGVSQASIFGSKSAIRIKADPSKLAARGMTVDDLGAAIRGGTSYVGSGQLDGPNRTFLLQPQGQLDNAAAYERLVIGEKDGLPIYLRDVAEARDSLQDERSERHFWARGKEIPPVNVVLAISRQPGANVVATAQRIRDLLPQIQHEMPASMHLIPVYDRSVTIKNSVHDVTETLLIAFALVVIVIFLFLGRASDTIIPAVALPMSMLLTFLAMYALHYSIDNLSLLALTLAIGFLVDDAIVFLENAVRRMQAGETAMEATLNGAKEISFTILSMTLSLAAVFIPFVFLPGLMGRTLQEFAITIIIAILASGVVSLTLTPLMCSRMLVRHENKKTKPWMERQADRVLGGVIRRYGDSLHFFLEHRWISALVWVVCFIGTIVLFGMLPKSLLPSGDSGFIRGIFMAQEGTSPDRMHEYQNRVDQIFQNNPAVDMSVTVTGLTGRLASSQAFALAFLKPVGERAPIDKVIGQMMGGMMQIPGVLPFLQANPVVQIPVGATSTNQGKFAYSISGTDPVQVSKAAQDLMMKLRSYPGFLFVSSDQKLQTPSLEIELLRNQAATYGINAQAILATLRNAYAQNYVYLIKKPTDQYQVIMEVKDAERTTPESLEKLHIRSNDGAALVPLKAVARWKEVLGPQSVNHINQFPSVTFFFQPVPGIATGDITKFVEKTAKETLPPTIQGSMQGEALVFAQTAEAWAISMIFAVFAMYVILGILYESYVHPITVLSSLPVAIVGGLATLLIFNLLNKIFPFVPTQELSLYGMVGLFLLIGIVKKNGIMVVDFALQRMAEGMDRVAAIHEACIERFRPIMMTTFAALMGALPLAVGHGADGKSRMPLGLIIVGGLVVSQLITLYVTPALFLYMEQFQEGFLDRYAFFRTHRVKCVKVEHHDAEPKNNQPAEQPELLEV